MEALQQERKVSVYMITYNNEDTVERALKSVRWANEIVIVDSFSNDRTVEIGRKFTDKLFQRKWPGHRDQYQYAADLTTHGSARQDRDRARRHAPRGALRG